ncbi:MAG: hypothetical protein DSZ02_02135 [Gammaproteobacteria bacterium]|nr:MAG: hypothetical protein DSZ02_02135 [Gammaproteobacteria bacterium]
MIRQTLLLLLVVLSTATLAQPTPVVISVKVEQITGINQKQENTAPLSANFSSGTNPRWH